MLGTGLKNGILLILIILILHFLIKNMLLDQAGKRTIENLETVEQVGKKGEPSIPSSQPMQPKSAEDNKNDLYKYVMEEGEMERFFEPQLLPEANDKFDKSYPVACDAKVIMTDDNITDVKKKAIRPEQLNNSFLVIHDYTDESPINGGKLFDGLTGYDEYNTMYEEYKCGS